MTSTTSRLLGLGARFPDFSLPACVSADPGAEFRTIDAHELEGSWCAVFFFASAGASAAYLTASEVFPLFQHPGTEFNYMLEGVMDYSHSRSVYRLQPGDSLQIDGEGAHGPVDLVEVPIRFLSVIAFPDSQV